MKRLSLLCCIGLAILLVALSIVGCKATTPTTEAKTLKIGGLFCLSGLFSMHDVPDCNELEVAADLMNEMGGITVNGQKYLVELEIEDCKSTMDGVTAATNKLVYDENIKFIIGLTAFFSSAASPITDANEVIRVCTYVCKTPGELDENTPYGFAGTTSSVENCFAVAKYLRQAYPNVKKVAIIIPDDGSVPYLAPVAKDLLAIEGLSLAGDPVVFSNDTVDFNPIVAKINNLKDADAVFQINGIGSHGGNVVKGLRALGNNIPLGATTPVPVQEYVTIAGEEACKDVFTCAITAGDPNMPPLAKEVVERTIAQYGPDISLYCQGADALWCLKSAIEAANSLDPTVVKTKWETMDSIDTLFGEGAIGGEKSYGIRHAVTHPVPIQILKDGVMTPGGWIDIGILP
jgi:branched-chain amino acid transport system substrate-binding protein